MRTLAVRVHRDTPREVMVALMDAIRRQDPRAKLHVAGNPVTFWVDTVLGLAFVESFSCVEFCIVSRWRHPSDKRGVLW